MRNFGKRSAQGLLVFIAMRAAAKSIASIYLFRFFKLMAVCVGRKLKT
jgi:hypothetical protein